MRNASGTHEQAAALTREDLAAMGLHERYELLKSRSLNKDEQALVLELDDDDTLEAFASNPSLSEETQAALARHGEDHVREALAVNEIVRAGVQESLARDAACNVRWALAANAAVTIPSQRVLCADLVDTVRYMLAENTEVVPEVLAVLAVDSDEGVRANVGRSPRITRELALTLSGDTRTRVREALAWNRAVELDAEFVLACLELSERGKAVVERVLQDSGADPEALAALREGWTGTLDELVVAASEFSTTSA